MQICGSRSTWRLAPSALDAGERTWHINNITCDHAKALQRFQRMMHEHEEFEVETDKAGEPPMPFWSETVRRVVVE